MAEDVDAGGWKCHSLAYDTLLSSNGVEGVIHTVSREKSD